MDNGLTSREMTAQDVREQQAHWDDQRAKLAAEPRTEVSTAILEQLRALYDTIGKKTT